MGIIVFQAAMPEELAPVRAQLQDCADISLPGTRQAIRGIHRGQEFVAIESGIGLVHASHATTIAATCLEETPLAIFSIGTAGAIPPHAAIGEVVAAKTLTAGDVNLTPFGYERGQVPGCPAQYTSDAALLAIAESKVDRLGDFVCVDSFVGDAEAQRLQDLFPGVGIVDMESTAAAQVAAMHEVPFISVRSITDLCSATQHEEEVDRSAQSSMEAALAIAVEFAAQLA
ncbi:MAG: 5'-methylthioadenosine/S-adenosylhomocysteine nucleosidase [Corynebacterium sp.]|nr:5'-methylthioadenosine/S-adenosylhomocysteine nucleosidase [Corynebacterium sp.]